MIRLTCNEFDAVTRTDFNVFVERVFAELNPTTPYADNFHIGVIAAKLEAVRRGEIRRLIINVPPRSLKSIIASVAFPAFVLGHDPSARIITASYGQDLADDLARDCRQILQQLWYRRLFPNTILSPSRQAVNAFETTAGGVRMATSVGGVLTGFGADLIIIDDPTKPDQALSDVERQSANAWFRHTLISRLNDKSQGAIVVVMQRLHEDDLVGHILELDDWEVLSFPAIAQHDEVHRVVTPHGVYTHRRSEGSALHPAREPLDVLAQIRKTLGSAHFAAQYLQSPAPPGGGLVKGDWFVRYDPQQPPSFDRIVQSWDTASKAKDMNDYSVCTTWGVKDKKLWLLSVYRKRLEYPDLKRAVREQASLHRANIILIEDMGTGASLIQELVRDGLSGVTRYKPRGDKITRLQAQTAAIEAGFVYIPAQAHWLEDYLDELMVFPRGKHDDQVDSTSQALDWVRTGVPSQGWLEYMKEKSSRVRSEETPNIRIRHPEPGVTLYTITGRRLRQDSDGCFLLTQEEWVPSLKGAGCYEVD